jgi:hypothetical protein
MLTVQFDGDVFAVRPDGPITRDDGHAAVNGR